MRMAIVDTETTGGVPSWNRVIEVGAIIVEDGKELDRFETLINPGMRIPGFITGITGITDEDVEKAPRFREIAARLHAFLAGSVFVAHNAPFDYAFLRHEFARTGHEFAPDRICTVRLSRKLFPGHVSHSLDAVMTRSGISVERRHRALDDAIAVWDFIQYAKSVHGEEYCHKIMEKLTSTPKLASVLPTINFS